MKYYAIFLDKNGYDGETDDAKADGLSKGNKYEVDYVAIGQSHSRVYLEGYGGYNTVMFDFVDEDGNEADIFKNPLWNPYLGGL
jgi:hypothetical protein